MRTLPNSKQNKPKIKLNLMQKVLLFIALIIMLFSSLPIMIVLLIGLLPTITTVLTEPKNSNKLTIVGCMNLAGVFISLVRIFNQYAANISISIMGNIFNVIIMLGFAAFGMALYLELPNLFVKISKNSAQRRLHNIDGKLEKLAKEWGGEAIADIVN